MTTATAAALPSSPAVDPAADAPEASEAVSTPRLRECSHCGLLQHLPAMPAHAVASCPRCGTVLRRRRSEPTVRPLALTTAALLLLLVAARLPFMDLWVNGIEQQTTLVTGPRELGAYGMVPLALVVLTTTLMAPTLRMAGLAWVLTNLRRQPAPAYLPWLFTWVERLKPWSMVEVFLLGVFVAYTKLIDLAYVEIGPALYALGGLMLLMAGVDHTLDPEAVWRRIDRRDRGIVPAGRPGPGEAIGCETCQLVNAPGEHHCVRCGSRLHRRKSNSISRTWALLAAAAVLYVPANVFPVLTLIRLSRGEPSTILGGVVQLAQAGMWPLALLVLFASILVPVLKLVSLTMMLVSVHLRTDWRLRRRTQLYRVVEFIGRWSMIDVFMISILTALVRMGRVASVYPGPGVLAFCSVVILTMLASASFDPRLMWDAAAERTRSDPPA